ncbi:MAG: hypothetical protein M3081_18905 [Gemmatimonadota bacterium]|nr:hypothetical protein [Gemmatimonadota bacterium]
MDAWTPLPAGAPRSARRRTGRVRRRCHRPRRGADADALLGTRAARRGRWIQITASHNPPKFNGFKLCIGTSAVYGNDIQRLLAIAREGRRVIGSNSVRAEQVIDRYIDDVVSRVGPLSRPMTVALDGANGVGAAPARRVLEAIGARVTCLSCTSDGTFPDHLPDPSVEANLAALEENVRKGDVDIGLAVDGDADRVGVIDELGRMVWGDRVLVLLARDVLARRPGATVIFDVKCSQALPDAI